MKTYLIQYKILPAFCIIITVCSIAAFSYRISESFYQKPIDFMLFMQTAKTFDKTGELYKRVDDYPDRYHPSAAIFKFPPQFQLLAYPLSKIGNGLTRLYLVKFSLIALYIASIFLLILNMKKNLGLNKSDLFYFSCVLVSLSCWFMPFFESIRWLLVEILLLFVFISSYALLQKNKYCAGLSGALLAFVSSIKIYPVFIAGYLLIQPKKTSLISFVLTSLFLLLASLYLFGLQEHLFYLQKILPVLLNEPVTGKWVNLNLEKFLNTVGLISEIDGSLFKIIRLLILLSFGFMLWKTKAIRHQESFAIFSLLIATLFFCFPNYWPQYQIFLLIPASLLIANFIQEKRFLLLSFVLITLSFAMVSDFLGQDLLAYNLERQGLSLEGLKKTNHTNTLLLIFKYSPLSIPLHFMYESRALIPLMLFILLTHHLYRAKLEFTPGSYSGPHKHL